MKTNSLDLYHDRKALYAKSDALRAELKAAEEEDAKLWKWYMDLTEEEYRACEEEADTKVNMSAKTLRQLRKTLEVVENSIKLMERLETELLLLESKGVV